MSSRQVCKQICLKVPGLVVISPRQGWGDGGAERDNGEKIKIRKPFLQEYCVVIIQGFLL